MLIYNRVSQTLNVLLTSCCRFLALFYNCTPFFLVCLQVLLSCTTVTTILFYSKFKQKGFLACTCQCTWSLSLQWCSLGPSVCAGSLFEPAGKVLQRSAGPRWPDCELWRGPPALCSIAFPGQFNIITKVKIIYFG